MAEPYVFFKTGPFYFILFLLVNQKRNLHDHNNHIPSTNKTTKPILNRPRSPLLYPHIHKPFHIQLSTPFTRSPTDAWCLGPPASLACRHKDRRVTLPKTIICFPAFRKAPHTD